MPYCIRATGRYISTMLAQLPLLPTEPKRRRGAGTPGRKARPERANFVRHRTRPEHAESHPVHVTMRRVRLAPSFRTQRIHAVIVSELSRARRKGVRVIEYSIQDDHLHLMIEGKHAPDLSAQMRKLFSRIAMTINATIARRGSLFRDRHHRHALETPREVRNALVHILFNARKHACGDARTVQALYDAPDPFSSAPWFTGWAPEARPPPDTPTSTARTTAPRTWLARTGWKRGGGLIRFDERPAKP
jgi:REP element-mobilizing transposase RayT